MEGTRLTKHLGGIALGALLAVALAVSPSWGATFKVPSTATPTIQSALNAALLAGAGPHTIMIAKGGGSGNYGAYHEEALIIVGPGFTQPPWGTSTAAVTSSGHVGLSFICQKGTVIDGAIPGGREGLDLDGTPHVGPLKLRGHGLRTFQVKDVTVRGCIFRGWDRSASQSPPSVMLPE